jgi:cytoskeletal protein RodZ
MTDTKSNNHYAVLDIRPGATHNEILHAYNRAKTTYSAGSLASYSLLEDDTNSSIMQEIEEAWTVLGNPARRREYDLSMGFATWVEESVGTSTSAATTTKNVTPFAMPRPVVTSAPAPQNTEVKTRPVAVETKSASFEPNPEFEARIKAAESVDGAFLKAVRIYRRFTVDSLAQRCKLSSSHIVAVEEEDASRFHQAVYLRGHVYLMCQALELPNPDRLAKDFVDRLNNEGKLARRTL